MKILPLVKGIQNDIASSGKLLKSASREGYQIAYRTSRIYNQNSLSKYVNVTRSIADKVLSKTTNKELAYLGGAIGLLLPVPFVAPILFGLGMLARISPKGACIVYDKSSQAHHFDISIQEKNLKNGFESFF